MSERPDRTEKRLRAIEKTLVEVRDALRGLGLVRQAVSPASELVGLPRFRVVHESGQELEGVARSLTDHATHEAAELAVPTIIAQRPGWASRLVVKEIR